MIRLWFQVKILLSQSKEKIVRHDIQVYIYFVPIEWYTVHNFEFSRHWFQGPLIWPRQEYLISALRYVTESKLFHQIWFQLSFENFCLLPLMNLWGILSLLSSTKFSWHSLQLSRYMFVILLSPFQPTSLRLETSLVAGSSCRAGNIHF